MTETLPEQLNQLPEPPLTGLAKVRADLSNFTKEMFGQTEAKEKEISSKEVADIAYEDFKHKLLDKKNAEGKQFYSAQLLGTLDFL
ncbi:MAG: hypothetical protein LBD75_01240 [Candidatus Peribacteria bacterium]|jgi:hypothetical protein|nr:hypothetical protein [Candidatus Peribacteria bacterium]